jgi:hypothetical protein
VLLSSFKFSLGVINRGGGILQAENPFSSVRALQSDVKLLRPAVSDVDGDDESRSLTLVASDVGGDGDDSTCFDSWKITGFFGKQDFQKSYLSDQRL